MSVVMAAVPPHERPRERLLARGAEALADRELIALVLRKGAPDTSALDLAAELLADYGSLERLARAQPEELAAKRGIGVAKAASHPSPPGRTPRRPGPSARICVQDRPPCR